MLSLDALIRYLKNYKIELNKASEETNKRGKSITLKSTHKRSSSSNAMKASEESDEEDEEPFDDEDDENVHLAEMTF